MNAQKRGGDCSMWIHEFERDDLSRDQFEKSYSSMWRNVSRAGAWPSGKKGKERKTSFQPPEKPFFFFLPLEQISSLNLIMHPPAPVSSAPSGRGGDTAWHTGVERCSGKRAACNDGWVWGWRTGLDVDPSSRGTEIKEREAVVMPESEYGFTAELPLNCRD